MSQSALQSFASAKLATVSANEGERHIVLGDHMRFIITGEQSGGAYAIMEQENGAGVGVPPHYHTREEEIFHVIEGEVRYNVYGQSIVAGAGMTVSIPRNVVHSFEFVTDARVLLTVVPAGIEEMFRELGQLPECPPDFAAVATICGKYGVFFAS
jgi:quercetin dioxygenase-like cupin family protein